MSESAPETSAPKTGGASKTFGFLGTKVGPLPLGIWLIAGVAIWFYFQRANRSTTGTNTGIDPVTGQPYSTELGAAEQQVTDLQLSQQGNQSTTGGQYQDNTAWSQAAINYLVARGVDPTQANQAITLFLSGQTLTTAQQADVNLAIAGIGEPPSPPGPSNTNPGQVIIPPGTTPPHQPPPPGPNTTGTVKQYPPPTGLRATSETGTSVSIEWKDTPASDGLYPPSYTVRAWPPKGAAATTTTVSAPNDKGGMVRTVVQGLKGHTTYKIQVWPNGGQVAPSSANVVATTK